MTTILKGGEGYMYDSMGDTMRVKLDAYATGGQYTLIEDTIKPGFHATLQLHRRHSETFYVIEGEIDFTLGSQVVKATPGTTIHVPANTPHAARSDRAGKMLTLFSPAGLEGALKAFSRLTPGQAQDPAETQAIMDEYDIVDLAQPPVPALLGFYDSLLAGDLNSLRGLFQGEPYINAPLQGQIEGEAALSQYVAEQRAWLSARSARPEFLDVIVSPERIVLELVVYLVQNGETIDLPVAIAADRDGDALSAVRVYHSTWPLKGSHSVRAPILTPAAEKLDEPAIVQAYMAGLHEGNKDLVLSLFAGNGYAREPSGSRFKYVGAEGLERFYGPALGDGGIVLHHCTATFDGHACAVEFIADEWAKVKLPPQAGLAVYELAGPHKLRAARIYDDVTPPFE